MTIPIEQLFIGLYRLCECKCGYLIPIINKMGNFARFKKGHNSRGESRPKGQNSSSWKGGKSNHYEYIIIYKPYYKYSNKLGWVFEHRYIIYLYLSILNNKITYIEGFDVHHKNGNEKDNRIENLQLLTKSDHTKHHNPNIDKSGRICNLCKTDKIIQWYNDIEGYLCDNCYSRIWYYRKKLGI